MRIKIKNYIIIIAEFVWHGNSGASIFLLPTIRCDKIGKHGFTFDVIWIKLWITFGCINLDYWGDNYYGND